MKTYQGKMWNENAGEQYVTVNGKPLPECQHVYNHSPDGFSWGYLGSGCSQLALAIMVDHFKGDNNRALRIYQNFKFDFISKWGDEWELTSNEIEDWLNVNEKSQ